MNWDWERYVEKIQGKISGLGNMKRWRKTEEGVEGNVASMIGVLEVLGGFGLIF